MPQKEQPLILILSRVAHNLKSEVIEGIFCQTRKRAHSIVSLCEELAYCRVVQNSPIGMIFNFLSEIVRCGASQKNRPRDSTKAYSPRYLTFSKVPLTGGGFRGWVTHFGVKKKAAKLCSLLLRRRLRLITRNYSVGMSLFTFFEPIRA